MNSFSHQSFVPLSLLFCLSTLMGCGQDSAATSGRVHAATLCDCLKTAGTDDVERCNAITQKAMSDLKDSPDQSLLFRQEMAQCRKEKSDK